jgi:hypothetical protein
MRRPGLLLGRKGSSCSAACASRVEMCLVAGRTATKCVLMDVSSGPSLIGGERGEGKYGIKIWQKTSSIWGRFSGEVFCRISMLWEMRTSQNKIRHKIRHPTILDSRNRDFAKIFAGIIKIIFSSV